MIEITTALTKSGSVQYNSISTTFASLPPPTNIISSPQCIIDYHFNTLKYNYLIEGDTESVTLTGGCEIDVCPLCTIDGYLDCDDEVPIGSLTLTVGPSSIIFGVSTTITDSTIDKKQCEISCKST